MDQATGYRPVCRIILDNLTGIKHLPHLGFRDFAEFLREHLLDGMTAEFETPQARSNHDHFHGSTATRDMQLGKSKTGDCPLWFALPKSRNPGFDPGDDLLLDAGPVEAIDFTDSHR